MFDMYKKFLKQDPDNWKWLIAIHLVVYAVGLILMLVVLALIIGKKFRKNDSSEDQLIFEDDMTDEELKKLDDDIH